MPAQLAVVFNISATAGQDNKLSVSAAPPVNIFPLGGALSSDSTIAVLTAKASGGDNSPNDPPAKCGKKNVSNGRDPSAT
jgi:hypothetical protein